MELEIGARVRVRTVSGAVSERVVCGYSDGVPLLCTVQELEAARQEEREPRGIGWPAEHMLGRVGEGTQTLETV